MTHILKNYLQGAATVLEIWPADRNLEIRKLGSQDDDAAAISGDWCKVGQDLNGIIQSQANGKQDD